MTRYFVQAKYTPEGAQAARNEGYASRLAANEANWAALGGGLEHAWWPSGYWDLAGIGHRPDGAMANVISQIHASGAFADVQIIEIFDTVTMDEARSAASYRPPGQ